jgi:MOSC domain-containing protein YiiM
MGGRVVSVNVGQIREIEWLGQTWQTAIWKAPVAGPIALRGVNLDGDDQADRNVHGGDDKAVYAYAREDAAWWVEQLGRPVEPGSFGENLTLADVDVTNAVVGEQWAIGSALLAVTQPRIPCFKLGARMSDPAFPQTFAAAGRPGAYLHIIEEGQLRAGDAVRIIDRPVHGVTVGEIADIYHHHGQPERLLQATGLPESWRAWAHKVIQARARTARR